MWYAWDYNFQPAIVRHCSTRSTMNYRNTESIRLPCVTRISFLGSETDTVCSKNIIVAAEKIHQYPPQYIEVGYTPYIRPFVAVREIENSFRELPRSNLLLFKILKYPRIRIRRISSTPLIHSQPLNSRRINVKYLRSTTDTRGGDVCCRWAPSQVTRGKGRSLGQELPTLAERYNEHMFRREAT